MFEKLSFPSREGIIFKFILPRNNTVGLHLYSETRQDHKIFRKVSNAKGHPLLSIMPRVKPSSYNLGKETCFKPKINTMRFKNSFINRLVFKYELAM